MLEPRRLAALSVAQRVAENLGEEVGKTAGYRFHLESNVSKNTRFEVVTEAILTKKLQNDPTLDGVSVVVLDEFHERSIHADLALAFLLETMEIRDDIFLLIMSATMESKEIADFLGAETLHIQGRLFPVKIEYRPKETVEQCVASILFEEDFHKDKTRLSEQSVGCPHFIHENVDNLWKNSGTQTENVDFERENVDKIPENVDSFSSFPQTPLFRTDSILVFLPGIFELRTCKSRLLEKIGNRADVFILHSSTPFFEQKKILSPAQLSSPRRVILSSSIAETSLTIPGVSFVIDSGFCRINRLKPSLGMSHLETERESAFNATQRAGRAGRNAGGTAIRLWNKTDVLLEKSSPEITRTELSLLVLECSAWGVTDANGLKWLTPPPEAAWNEAKKLLLSLGCIDENGKITPLGTACLCLPLNPRLSCVALSAKNALLTVLRFSEFAQSAKELQERFLRTLSKRIERTGRSLPESKQIGEIVLSGFPDRIAKRCALGNDFTEYQFPSGRKARLAIPNGALWIVAIEVDAGESVGFIQEYEKIENAEAEKWIFERAKSKIDLSFDEKTGKIEKSEIVFFGEIELKRKKCPVSKNDFLEALCQSVEKRGLSSLPIDSETAEFLVRAEFCARYANDDALFEKLTSLQKNVREWLLPFLSSEKISETVVKNALKWHLDAHKIDENAPKEMVLPNGKKNRLRYEKSGNEIRVILECIIQRLFGVFETPKVLGKRVLLRLLSPARRPLQITDDLEHFWSGSWQEICKEMKGRYPKHNWNYRVIDKIE